MRSELGFREMLASAGLQSWDALTEMPFPNTNFNELGAVRHRRKRNIPFLLL